MNGNPAMKSHVVSLSALLAVGLMTFAARSEVRPAITDALTPPAPGAVQIHGQVGKLIDRCIDHRIATEDVSAIIVPFRDRNELNWTWRCEFWGKWVTSAADAYRYRQTPALRALVEDAAAQLIATQRDDGYIGTQKQLSYKGNWDVWGRKYTLLGLLDCYQRTGAVKDLQAAQRVADHLMAELPADGKPRIVDVGQWNGMAASSIIEPLVKLYFATGQKKYLDYAASIPASWEAGSGPRLISKAMADMPVYDMFPGPIDNPKGYGDYGKSKSYEMMSCYDGLIELYRATGDVKYIQPVKNVYGSIVDHELTIIGSGSDWERWNNGRGKQARAWMKGMETCVTVYWMKLNAQLLELTGEARYAEAFERSMYNTLLGAQKPDGTWWVHHVQTAGFKEAAPAQCDVHQNCCVANGPRGMMMIPKLAIMRDEEGPVVNLYEPMRATIQSPRGQDLTWKMTGDYPVADTVTLTLGAGQAEKFTLKLRVPDWSAATKIAVNDESIGGVKAGTFAAIDRTWQDGDRVTITFDMTPRVVTDRQVPGYIAIMRGPLVFVRDQRLTDGPLDAPISPATDGYGRIDKATLQTPDDGAFWLTLTVPQTGGDPQKLCDMISAGNTWTEASSYRIWLPTP